MRRTTIALSAVALTVTLGACGQSPTGANESGDQAGQKGGAPFADVSALVSGAGSSMSEKKTVTVSTEISGGTPAASGMGNMECQIDIAKTSMSCDGGPMAIVTTADAMYMKSPQLAQMSGDPSKPWLKISADPNDPMGKMMGQQAQAFQKLTDFKDMLPPGSKIVSNSKEQVGGKDATRYETVTDLTTAAAEAPEELKGAYKILVDGGVKEIKQTIWVDSDGLPVKATSTTPPMNIMGQQVPEQVTTVNYKDWGKPVTINVPAPNEVQDMKMPSIPQPPN